MSETRRNLSSESADTAKESGSEGASKLVWRKVLEDIYAYRYLPGQRLTEADLTRRFGVGRGSVREAINRLAAEGAIKLERHKGATVRGATKEEILQGLVVIEALVPLAAKLASQNIDGTDMRGITRELCQHFKSLDKALSGFDLAVEKNRFYRTLLAASGNLELSRLLRQLNVHSMRIQLAERRPQSEVIEDYIKILMHVLDGDASGAEEAALNHIRADIQVANSLPDS